MTAAFGLMLMASGYVLIHFYPRTAIPAYRAQGQRLLLYSACAAVVLLLLTRMVIMALGQHLPQVLSLLSDMSRTLAPAVPFRGTIIGSMALAIILAFALRSDSLADEISVRTIYREGDELEILLWEALHQEEPVEMTLETGKVYVGIPVETARAREPRRYVRLLPYVSGFRDNNQNLQLTVQYLDLLETIEDESNGDMGPRELELVIPVDRIVSARMFDLTLPSQVFGGRQVEVPVSYTATSAGLKYPLSGPPS